VFLSITSDFPVNLDGQFYSNRETVFRNSKDWNLLHRSIDGSSICELQNKKMPEAQYRYIYAWIHRWISEACRAPQLLLVLKYYHVPAHTVSFS
jgi:hypothetical protein